MPMNEEKLVPFPIPALGVVLINLEKQKGSSLTMEEVIDARDKAVCVMLPESVSHAMNEQRGYRDVDPQNVWASWLAFRAEATGN